ncbi:MAG TPA: hypothetical protein V6C89_00230 [Drouetiella sp.]|jgi:hypothetical protein
MPMERLALVAAEELAKTPIGEQLAATVWSGLKNVAPQLATTSERILPSLRLAEYNGCNADALMGKLWHYEPVKLPDFKSASSLHDFMDPARGVDDLTTARTLKVMTDNRTLFRFLDDEKKLAEPLQSLQILPEEFRIEYADQTRITGYPGTNRFNVSRANGVKEIHFPVEGNHWRNVKMSFPDGRLEHHEDELITIEREAATHDFSKAVNEWPAHSPGRPLKELTINTLEEGIVAPPGARHYPDLKLQDVLSPQELPPLRDGYLRIVHITNPESAKGIAENGLVYIGELGSTVRPFGPEAATDFRSFVLGDPRYNGGVAVTMDVPSDLFRLHNRSGNFQPTHTVVPPGYTVGIVGMPKNAQPLVNRSSSWVPPNPRNIVWSATDPYAHEGLNVTEHHLPTVRKTIVQVRNPSSAELPNLPKSKPVSVQDEPW